MAEIINSIKEVFDLNPKNQNYIRYDGFEIITSEHKYLLLIENDTCCCEDWGYFASNDNEQSFVGKELVAVELTDTGLKTKKVDEVSRYGFDEGGIQFVNFKTTEGNTFQIAVYNAQNGFYGHGILFIKDKDILLDDAL